MSKNIVKLYQVYKNDIKVIEINECDKAHFLNRDCFTSYEDAKQRLNYIEDLEKIIRDIFTESHNKLFDRVSQLEKDVTMVGDRGTDLNLDVKHLSERIEVLDKGQKMLLDRVVEIDKELDSNNRDIKLLSIISIISLVSIIVLSLWILVN